MRKKAIFWTSIAALIIAAFITFAAIAADDNDATPVVLIGETEFLPDLHTRVDEPELDGAVADYDPFAEGIEGAVGIDQRVVSVNSETEEITVTIAVQGISHSEPQNAAELGEATVTAVISERFKFVDFYGEYDGEASVATIAEADEAEPSESGAQQIVWSFRVTDELKTLTYRLLPKSARPETKAEAPKTPDAPDTPPPTRSVKPTQSNVLRVVEQAQLVFEPSGAPPMAGEPIDGDSEASEPPNSAQLQYFPAPTVYAATLYVTKQLTEESRGSGTFTLTVSGTDIQTMSDTYDVSTGRPATNFYTFYSASADKVWRNIKIVETEITGFALQNINATGVEMFTTDVAERSITLDRVHGGAVIDVTFTNRRVARPDVAIEKTSDVTSLQTGNSVTYLTTLTNTGDFALESVAITDNALRTVTGAEFVPLGNPFGGGTTITAGDRARDYLRVAVDTDGYSGDVRYRLDAEEGTISFSPNFSLKPGERVFLIYALRFTDDFPAGMFASTATASAAYNGEVISRAAARHSLTITRETATPPIVFPPATTVTLPTATPTQTPTHTPIITETPPQTPTLTTSIPPTTPPTPTPTETSPSTTSPAPTIAAPSPEPTQELVIGEPTPPLGEYVPPPKTGDDAPLQFALALLAMSATLAAFAIVARKKA
ncbi:MAG: hypothetical protein LBN30_11020 [Oscillospiraceae bacterium]|jgi:hypothetical protein|nr:hypothetical protein [Oscillospiraceae bacterium]